MKLEKVQKILKAELIWKFKHTDLELGSCYASDLISDMLNFQGFNSILLTGLTNPQVIRTAEILDLVAICFVRGKRPQPETIELAQEKELPLLITSLTMYESCGRLYETGLRGATKTEAVDNCQKKK